MTAFDQAWAIMKKPMYETDIPGLKFVSQGENDPIWADDTNVHGNASLEVQGEEGETEMWKPNDFMQYWAKPNAKTPAHWKDVSGGNRNPKSGFYGLTNPASPREIGSAMPRSMVDAYSKLNVGEDDNIWGMPFLSFPKGRMTNPGIPNWHDGRHRMSELIESGYGDIPVPIRVNRSGRHMGVNRDRIGDLGIRHGGVNRDKGE